MTLISPRLEGLLKGIGSQDVSVKELALKQFGSFDDEDITSLIDIAMDRVEAEPSTRGNYHLKNRHYPLEMQLSAIRALAESQSKRALDYLSKILEPETFQIQEAHDPGDMYNMGGRSGAEEYFPPITASIPRIRGNLLETLCVKDGSSPYTSYYSTRDTHRAQQRIRETAAK
jgi:hypothetical protein